MNEKRAIEVLDNEINCVNRRAKGECNGGSDCQKCDLLLTDTEIIWALTKAIKALSIPEIQQHISLLKHLKGVSKSTVSKSIRLWSDEKVILLDALRNVLSILDDKLDTEQVQIYRRVIERLNLTHMSDVKDGSFCYVDLYGGAYEACICALEQCSQPLASVIIVKMRNAPNKFM